MQKKAVILFGPPGAGKGTLSSLCEKEFNWKQLSTGNLCREQIQGRTELGLQVEALIASGQLVPDAIIMEMIEQWISNNQSNLDGIIFDGTPRTVSQASFIDDMLKNKFLAFDVVVIRFQVDKQELLKRILSRLICSNKSCQSVYSTLENSIMTSKNGMICDKCGAELYRRCDDTEEALKKRLDDYYQYEKDVLHYYSKQNVTIHNIDGNKSIEDVFKNVEKIA